MATSLHLNINNPPLLSQAFDFSIFQSSRSFSSELPDNRLRENSETIISSLESLNRGTAAMCYRYLNIRCNKCRYWYELMDPPVAHCVTQSRKGNGADYCPVIQEADDLDALWQCRACRKERRHSYEDTDKEDSDDDDYINVVGVIVDKDDDDDEDEDDDDDNTRVNSSSSKHASTNKPTKQTQTKNPPESSLSNGKSRKKFGLGN
ncbi:hypothetical protein QBC38DRAFT_483786 [Podospora fimiseda]|uniref:Uncharacterized protein n=1 Tax=Podospora fimiseda TaxID=252190 RepID=A0AAN7GUJ3_9PEZI|nr:hypothetical protein QBC38DRAFT_483786 [Podospora fimiseda]